MHSLVPIHLDSLLLLPSVRLFDTLGTFPVRRQHIFRIFLKSSTRKNCAYKTYQDTILTYHCLSSKSIHY